MSWLVNVVVAFPFYVLIIALVFVLGPGTRNIYIAITLVGWVSYTRIVRGEVLVAKRQEYVLAARAAGLSDAPDHGPPPAAERDHAGDRLLDVATSCSTILAIVTLGYLGLGVQPPTAGLGHDDRRRPDVPDHAAGGSSTFPGIAVVITALGLSLLGDGLADLLRPE